MAVNDPVLLRFLEKAVHGDIRVTFDPAAAIDDPAAELLHGQHPLVKAIAKFYDGAIERIPPVAAVQVETSTVPESDYFFVWASINEKGLQEGRSLWVEAVSADGSNRLDPDDAAALLHQMVLFGEPWKDFQAPNGEYSVQLLERCLESVVARVLERKAEALKQNRAPGLTQDRVVEIFTDAKRREKQRLLDSHQLHNRLNAIKLVEAQLRKLEADLEHKLGELEKGKVVTVSFKEEGAGYVSVHAPKR